MSPSPDRLRCLRRQFEKRFDQRGVAQQMPHSPLNQAILDSLSEGVFTVDSDWRITSIRAFGREITGVARDEAAGQQCSDVLHSTLCEARCPIRRTLAGSKPVTNERCYFVDIDGERVPISVSAATLVDEQGIIIGGVETSVTSASLKRCAARAAVPREQPEPGDAAAA